MLLVHVEFFDVRRDVFFSFRALRQIPFHLEGEHQSAAAAVAACACTGCGGRSTCDGGTGVGGRSVVVVPVVGLDEVHRQVDAASIDKLAGDNRADDEDDEEEEEGEVHDRVADDAALAKLGLLERVDRRADLATAKFVSICQMRGWEGLQHT